MRIIVATILALLAVGVIAQTVNAAERHPFMPYIDWLTENSTLEYHGEPLPTIKRYSQPALQTIFYGPENVAQAERGGTKLLQVEAIYDPRTNEMLLQPELDITNSAAAGWIVIHELVHFLQEVNEMKFQCPRASERQAYDLQRDWQDATNDQNIRPDRLTVFLISECPNFRY